MVTEILKTKFEDSFEAFIEWVEAFSNYFIIRKHISLSEFTLSWLAFALGGWFAVFGAKNANYEMILGAPFWASTFLILSAAHFAGFFARKTRVRAFICCGYALLWSFWMLIAVLSKTTAPAVPIFLVLTLFSIFIAVRLFRGKTNDD